MGWGGVGVPWSGIAQTSRSMRLLVVSVLGRIQREVACLIQMSHLDASNNIVRHHHLILLTLDGTATPVAGGRQQHPNTGGKKGSGMLAGWVVSCGSATKSCRF